MPISPQDPLWSEDDITPEEEQWVTEDALRDSISWYSKQMITAAMALIHMNPMRGDWAVNEVVERVANLSRVSIEARDWK